MYTKNNINNFKNTIFSLILLIFLSISTVYGAPLSDPLPDWRDTATKQAIIQYVQEVTDSQSSKYIKQEDRVAVFDNDGTVQLEKPFSFIDMFACLRVKRLAEDHPEWKDDPIMKDVIATPENKLSELIPKITYENFRIIFNHGNSEQSMDSLNAALYEYVYTFQHPRFHQPPAKLVYKPMVELVKYFKDNGFIVYFVSGSTTDYLRQFSEKNVGIAKNNVIGWDYRAELKYDKQGKISIYKLNDPVLPISNNAGKPINIARYIGRQPVVAVGNSNGDYEMLTYTKQNKLPSLCLMVAHTDGEREYEYDFGEHVWQGVKEQGWLVIDMKKDFATIF